MQLEIIILSEEAFMYKNMVNPIIVHGVATDKVLMSL